MLIGWGQNSVSFGPSNVVLIAAAAFTGVTVKKDGTVEQGTRATGLPLPQLSNVATVSIGETDQGTRNVALLRDGTVASWHSQNYYEHEAPPPGLSNVVAIAAGSYHTLAVKEHGTVVGWGFNRIGQAIGVPTTHPPYVSAGTVRINGEFLSNVVSVAANHNYGVALKKDGTIVAWGKMLNNLYPATVPDGLSNVVAIAAGDNFCLVITTNNAVADKFRQRQ